MSAIKANQSQSNAIEPVTRQLQGRIVASYKRGGAGGRIGEHTNAPPINSDGAFVTGCGGLQRALIYA